MTPILQKQTLPLNATPGQFAGTLRDRPDVPAIALASKLKQTYTLSAVNQGSVHARPIEWLSYLSKLFPLMQ